jgi:hypothetical protein
MRFLAITVILMAMFTLSIILNEEAIQRHISASIEANWEAEHTIK